MTPKIEDFPKLHSPFVREVNEDGEFVVTPEIAEGYEWVFEDDDVMAVEKLHGTNVSIVVKQGIVTDIFNRTTRIPLLGKGGHHIIEGIMSSIDRRWIEQLPDGQHFGELIGEKVNGNEHNIEGHLWVPFSRARKNFTYTSWGKYPKTFDSINNWFKNELFSLFASEYHGQDLDASSIENGTFCEGIIFTHPDSSRPPEKRFAKLRRDMFDWYEGDRH